MATEAQTSANRANSQKSTGPRTSEGKAAVSQNAVKHGLFADATVVNGENQGDYDLHRDGFLAEMRPVGVMESMLAERIVSLAWRLRRAERMQNQAIDEMIKGLKPSPLQLHLRSTTPAFLRASEEDIHIPEPKFALGRVAKRDWANNRVLDRMMLYERRIESSLYRTMTKLKTLQIMRRIEHEDAVEKQSAGQSGSAAQHRGDAKKQNQRPAFGRKSETRSSKSETRRIEKTKPILEMGKCVSTYASEAYDNMTRLQGRENKAKQTQFEAPARKGAAGTRGSREHFAGLGRREAPATSMTE